MSFWNSLLGVLGGGGLGNLGGRIGGAGGQLLGGMQNLGGALSGGMNPQQAFQRFNRTGNQVMGMQPGMSPGGTPNLNNPLSNTPMSGAIPSNAANPMGASMPSMGGGGMPSPAGRFGRGIGGFMR